MNNRWCSVISSILTAVLFTVLLSGCSSINDDLSDCTNDTDYNLTYEMLLVTNISTELQTQLTTVTELKVKDALAAHLNGIFTDRAHDINLSFYDTEGDSVRLYQKTDIIDESQKVYTLNLPMREYMHTAIANVVNNTQVNIVNDNNCHPARLLQKDGDEIDSHTTGLFTAREPMHVLEGVNQTFNVKLYMANCAAAIVVDTTGVKISNMRVVTTGFASSFSICDSIYHFDANPPLVKASQVNVTDSRDVCFCSVNFPSRDALRTVVEPTDYFDTTESAYSPWQYKVYVTLPDNSVTETVINMNRSLLAGELIILKGHLLFDGSVAVADPTVGVSVTLNWNDAGNHEVDL